MKRGAFMITKFEKRNPKRFWQWFSRHSDEFHNINNQNYHQYFCKMDKFMEKFNPYLGFEFVAEEQNGKKELVITANGNIRLFDTVIELIDTAPKKLKDKWIFTALRQPSIDEVLIHFNDMVISSADIFYELEESESELGKWDIFIYIDGVFYDSTETEDYIASVMYSTLDGIIGEYVNATKISDIILVEKGELEAPKTIFELRKEINGL